MYKHIHNFLYKKFLCPEYTGKTRDDFSPLLFKCPELFHNKLLVIENEKYILVYFKTDLLCLMVCINRFYIGK